MPGGGGRASRPVDEDSNAPFDLSWVPKKPNPAAGDGGDEANPHGGTSHSTVSLRAKQVAERFPPAKRCLAGFDEMKLAAMGEQSEIPIRSDWPQSRQFLGHIISSNLFVVAMGIVISINIVIVLVEADRRAQCVDAQSPDCPANFSDIRVPDRICGIIYIIELLMRVYVYQSKFCCSFWNITDTIVVLVSLSGEIFESFVQNAALIRLVRIVRIVKILRVITMFQELYLMIASLASTMRTIFWACLMLVIVISIMSLLAVEMLHPLHVQMMEDGEVCDRCPTAFSSITNSMVTFFATIIMGDGIFDVFVPLIEEDVSAAAFLLTSVALVYLGFSNLVLSVIVDKANEARCQDTTYQALVARKMREKAQQELESLWQEVDVDGSNTVTLEELRQMHETSENFKIYFKSHNIDMELLTYAWSVMDPDGDGQCDFHEFAETLVRLRSTDAGPATAFMKHQLGHVVAELSEIKDLLNKTEKTPFVGIQEHCDDECDKFTVVSKVESKFSHGLVATVDENLRGVADLIAKAIPTMDTVQGPMFQVDVDQPRNFDFACPTPGGSGTVTPNATQPNPMTTAKWRLFPGASAKQPMRNESPSEAAEELVELLKYAYEGTQPLNMQYLRGLEWHYADLCQRVEVQLGRLMAIVQDSDFRARMELFCCSSRLISSLGAAMPRILPDPSLAFARVHFPVGNGSETKEPNLPEPPQKVNVFPSEV